MYTLRIKGIKNQATNYYVNGNLSTMLNSLLEKPEAKELFTLEGPISDFSETKTEAKIVAYDWQDFINRVVAKQPEDTHSQYKSFQKAVILLKAAA